MKNLQKPIKVYLYHMYKNTTKNGNSMHYYWLVEAETGYTMYPLLYSLGLLKRDSKDRFVGTTYKKAEIIQKLIELDYEVVNHEAL